MKIQLTSYLCISSLDTLLPGITTSELPISVSISPSHKLKRLQSVWKSSQRCHVSSILIANTKNEKANLLMHELEL